MHHVFQLTSISIVNYTGSVCTLNRNRRLPPSFKAIALWILKRVHESNTISCLLSLDLPTDASNRRSSLLSPVCFLPRNSRGVHGAAAADLRRTQTTRRVALLVSAARGQHPRHETSLCLRTHKNGNGSLSQLPSAALGKRYNGHLLKENCVQFERFRLGALYIVENTFQL